MSAKKILCPIDFSAGSQQAMRVAVRVAGELGAELVIVHAFYVPPTAFTPEYMFPPTVLQQMSEDAERGLAEAARTATGLGAKQVSTKLLEGVPWLAINEMLEDPAFDLVVIGTHGRTALARVLLGSVTEKVVRHAPCSVLTVRPDARVERFRHILCPVDFSACARVALDRAADLARAHDARLTLLHVIEIPVSYSGDPPVADLVPVLDKQAAELLDRWATETATKLPVPVNTRCRIGRAGAETIAVLDDDHSIDLVVVGSHGRTGIKRALLGSVAEKVVRHAKCPVLVARTRS
jgi:nucleotide-binding universal stress UspA family protein